MSENDWLAVMRRQHGVITRTQALLGGLSDNQIRQRCRSGTWLRVHAGVYRHVMHPPTWRSELSAATLAADAVASHASAAALHGIGEFDGVGTRPGLEVTKAKGRYRRYAGVTVHQSTQMDRIDRVVVDHIACTGLARTVLDLGAQMGPRRLGEVIDALVREQRLTTAELWDVLVRHSARGRNGCGPMRAALEERRRESTVPLSEWSRMVKRLLVAAGLPEPALEHRVRQRTRFVAQVDLAYPDERLAIELDSVAWHHNLASFHRDRGRTRKLAVAGWTVLPFTWRDYSERPAELVAQVAEFLARKMVA